MANQFQTQVNTLPAPGVAGDFASANPRATVLAGAGALVAGAGGVTVGMFAWATPNQVLNPSTGEYDFYNNVQNTGVGAVTGFVHREQQGLITAFLGASSMLVPVGLPVVLHQAGDFWAVNTGAQTVPGQNVYANLATGAISCATGTLAAAVGFTGSGSISSIGTVNTLTMGTVSSGTVNIGDYISGTGILSGTYIVGLGSGSGGTGTYYLNQGGMTVPGNTAITGNGTVLTKWLCMSEARTGELVKISSWALG